MAMQNYYIMSGDTAVAKWENGELTVLKINGKWVSTQGLSLLYSIYHAVQEAVGSYL